jgi:hypothetical protein
MAVCGTAHKRDKRNVGMDCNFEARAKTEEEILKKAVEHAQTGHKMKKEGSRLTRHPDLGCRNTPFGFRAS